MIPNRIHTTQRCELVDITALVQESLNRSGFQNGLCAVFVPHTTAGVLINENADPDVASDLLGHLERLIPKHQPEFLHDEGNADAHIKSVLTGSSVLLPVEKGKLVLGTWQGIFFAEYDGPRQREFHVKLLPG